MPSAGFTSEVEASADQNVVGTAGKKWSQYRRSVVPVLKRSNTALLFVNQEYDKIPGPGRAFYGGKAIPFMSSIIVRLLQPKRVPDDHNAPLQATVVRPMTIKNKTAQNGRQPEPGITFAFTDGGVRIDYIPELVLVGSEMGVFTDVDGLGILKSNKTNWYFEGELVANGTAKVTAALREDGDLCDRVEAAVYAAIDAQNGEPMVLDLLPNLEDEAERDDLGDAPDRQFSCISGMAARAGVIPVQTLRVASNSTTQGEIR